MSQERGVPERNYSLQLCRLLNVYYIASETLDMSSEGKNATTLWWKQFLEYQLYNRSEKQSIQIEGIIKGFTKIFFQKDNGFYSKWCMKKNARRSP